MTKGINFKLIVIFLLLSIHLSLFSAEAATAVITAETLEYFEEKGKYVAVGNVKMERDDTILYADEVVFFRETADVEAKGDVIFECPDTLITAERAKINLDAETGRLYNAVIFFKGGNQWISGDIIKKLGEGHYYAPVATFTTCNPRASFCPPDWHFRGENVDIILGERLTAHNVTFRVRGLPVLYSPYIWAPIVTERQTGFLFPMIGYTSRKGFRFSPAFFWAIAENRDATIYLDYFGRRGIGVGVEYRYLNFDNRGRWFLYHIDDRELERRFYKLEGMHKQKLGNIRGFIDINYVGQADFFREFGPTRELRIQRFLQSTAEVSLPLRNSRLYLLSQYWVDLKDEDLDVPQRLPGIGYAINPISIGPLMFTKASRITNFHREEGWRGQRLDIKPTLSHAFGNRIRVFQTLSLRTTAYDFEDESPDGPCRLRGVRTTFQYRVSAMARFLKQSEAATHTVEPSLSYTFIPETRQLPLFDPYWLYQETSVAKFSLLNISNFRAFSLTGRLIQSYDFNKEERPLRPTRLDVSFRGPFTVGLDMTYDLYEGTVETFNARVAAEVVENTNISLSRRYRRADEAILYKAAVDSFLTNRWSVSAAAWYDAKAEELRDATLETTYREQCWAISVSLSRRPGDNIRPPEYSFMVIVELKGLGAIGFS